MEFTTPSVELIAETKLEEAGIKKYLTEIGATEYELDPEISDIENLVMVAGKACYKSFQVGLNPNVTKVRDNSLEYLDNINKVGHGSVIEHGSVTFAFWNVSRVFCYHPETEVLTNMGWKNITKLDNNEIILTKNPKNGECRWSTNKKLHSFRYCGPLYYFENSQIKSPAVTPDHIMWCAKYDLRKSRNTKCDDIINNASKIRMEDIYNKRFVIDSGIRMEHNLDSPAFINIGNYTYNSTLLFKWLGLMTSNGYILKTRNRCSIVKTKIKNLDEIRILMDELFANRWKEYAGKFCISDKELKLWVINTIGRTNKDRTLYKLLDKPKHLLKSFIDGMVLGDGTSRNNSNFDHTTIYCGGNKHIATDLQSIIAVLGKSSNVRIEKDRIGQFHMVNGQKLIHKNKYYILEIHSDRSMLVKKHHQKIMNYDGFVFCPETDDGLIYVRNSGVAFWSGNTHELVRHRAGTAMSQESLRYVRLTKLGFWIPEVLKTYDKDGKGVETVIETVKLLEEKQKQLAEIYGIEQMKDFSTKKKLTSAFRRIAPIGLSTAIIWTMNMRAARHLIQIRTSRHAEEEIRLVFDQVAKTLVSKFPGLLGDLKCEIVDGIGEWSSKYASAPYDQEKISKLENEIKKLNKQLEDMQKQVNQSCIQNEQ